MALIQFNHGDTIIQKRMFAPKKRVSELQSWLKDARKKIPNIPEADHLLSGWAITSTLVTPNLIHITWSKYNGETASLVIDRDAASIG